MSAQPEKKISNREVEVDKGVYVVKGAAPKTGTRLTRERIAEDFRSLNRRSGRSTGRSARSRPAEG